MDSENNKRVPDRLDSPDFSTKNTGFAFDSLEAVRKKLLDLGSRNPLLNYKHPKASCIRLLNFLPDKIYKVLTSEDAISLYFISVPEPTERELIEAGYIEVDPVSKQKKALEHPTAKQWAKHLRLDTYYDSHETKIYNSSIEKCQDVGLQTLMYAPELEARLRGIRSKAETALDESGSNILYLALGFLEWYESRDSDVVRMAPLFTLPVHLERSKLDRSQGVYLYTLTLKDDGLLTNITLREKLAHDFGLILPSIDEGLSPEAYFQVIDNTILKNQPKWRLCRDVSLVLLGFSKQIMYQDLNPDNWPSDSRIDDHELIKMFFSEKIETNISDCFSYESEHPIDEIEEVHDRFPLIYDADSSQHSALIDVVKGYNLVIEGPPGSGKSQTITNLISACIADGKSVLFVSEKMAALNVVKSKLDKAGLGDFCLELHSHKTHKIKILEGLTKRLDRQGEYRSPSSIKDDIDHYENLKNKLNKYVQEVNGVWRNTGLTIHEILNKATRYREQYGINPSKLNIKGVNGLELTQVKQKEVMNQADMLANIYSIISSQEKNSVIENHYWHGVYNSELKNYQIKELYSYLGGWSNSLKKMCECWSRMVSLYQIDASENISFDQMQSFTSSLGQLPDLDKSGVLSEILYINNHNDQFSYMIKEYKRIHDAINYLSISMHVDRVVNPESSKILTLYLNVFKNLGVNSNITLNNISDDLRSIAKLKKSIDIIKNGFDRIRKMVPDGLKVCFEVTPEGLKEFLALIDLINKLPSELWKHRDELFDNPDLDGLLGQLTNRVRKLSPIHRELRGEFDLQNLPSSSELIRYKDILDGAGFFHVFSREWRNASSSVINLSFKPKSNKNKLFGHLSDLISYSQGLEEIDRLNDQDPVLNKLYRGVDTPVDKIVALRKWYQVVRDEYGVGFGDRVSIANALFSIDRSLVSSIADAANHSLFDEVYFSSEVFQNTVSKYNKFKRFNGGQFLLHGEKNPVSELQKYLSVSVKKLSSIIINDDVPINEMLSINSGLIQIHKDIGEWFGNEVTQYFVPGILPLSMRAGGFSGEYYTAANNTLNVSKVLMGNLVLSDVITGDPSPERYKGLCDFFPNLESIESDVVRNRDLFVSLGEVNLLKWFELSSSGIDGDLLRNRSALNNPDWLSTWLDYVKLRGRLYSKGWSDVIDSLESKKIQPEELKDIVKLTVFHSLAEEIFSEHSYLSEFNGMEQTTIRDEFQKYDRNLMSLQRQKIAYNSSRVNIPSGNSSGKVSMFTETSLIRHEAGKKTRHIAVRNLLKRAGRSIQALKPCFMMSPMSVAQYLEPGEFKFDLVVMDEASQIRPEDALGSIARASKLVVVGDPKQLPPTNFFNSTMANDDGEDVVALEESESILESVTPMFKNRRLRWHYRSRHESLIAFSNQNFYDSNLILFPSPFQQSEEFGIRFKFVPKGRFYTRRNVEEAREIVDAVSDHLKKNPDESVGIVAMNSNQQLEIEAQLDQLAKDDPLLAVARDKNRLSDDPLFIKNIENVQGDERDVIIISMTYGPEQVGSRTMHQRFGSINSQMGWRRLNVLFTRSRKRMHIFSTMSSGHIRVSSNSSRGVRALKAFLEYCETGHLNQSVHTGKPADSDFEIAVMDGLAQHGYECEPQLGVAGYYLDLAVRDPGQPGRFLMGVECDGATYHSAKSTRDRDRLRQDILENLGWKIRRIWSTDWFKNPQAQIERIVQELDGLKTAVVETNDLIQQKMAVEETIEPIVEELCDLPVGDLSNDLDLKARFRSLSENIIKNNFPDVINDQHLLRPAMVEAFLYHLPCSKAEFLEKIPSYLRKGTDVNEAQKYLGDVLDLIANYE